MEGERYAADAALRGWRLEEAGGRPQRTLALDLVGGAAEVSLASDGTTRLRAAPGAGLPSAIEHGVERGAWEPTRLDVREADGLLRVSSASPALVLEIEAEPFALRVIDRRGATLAELSALAFGGDGATRVRLATQADEGLFGLGEKPGGLDRRGSLHVLRNREPDGGRREPHYLSVPFLLLHRRAGGAGDLGVLLDVAGPSRFDAARSRRDRIEMRSEADGIDVALFPGPTPREVMERFGARAGRPPLPPLWALAHHQSRWSYRSERQVRALAREIRARRIPTGVIHLDIDHMEGYRVFTWSARRFPDPERMLKDLAEQGFRVVAIVDPGVKRDPDWPVYAEGLERGLYCEGAALRAWPGAVALPDFDRPEVRRWWAEQHARLLDAGVAGIWNDMNEPAVWSRDLRLGRAIVPLGRARTEDLRQADPADPSREVPHERVRNLYGLQHCRATREALTRLQPGRRGFVLTRSGTTGIQRYAAVWTGDNASRWSDLRASIVHLLSLSISGVPFCGADIGGFFGRCTPELYARWIQLGALYPFARTHSSWNKRRQEPWRFGPRVEEIARAALELRMRLLPYLYGLFREAERSGAPVWRPLFFEFPDDPEAARVEDQLMLGPALLVAPVVHRGARQRDVYLPPGAWYAWHDDARFVGPRRLRVRAPLERLPLFVRAGSVLPTRESGTLNRSAANAPVALEIFPGGDAALERIEDDGESLAYREGVVARTALRLWSRAGGRLRLEVGRREGPHRIPERGQRATIHACPEPAGVRLDAVALAEGDTLPGWRRRGGAVDVRWQDRGQGVTLEIDPAP